MPGVNPKKQHRPTFPAAQVSQIVEGVKGVYKMLFIVLAATGLRIGEAIGLKVENVLDDTKGVTLEKYLVLSPCTEMWLRMRGVPPNFPHSEEEAN